MPEVLGHFVTQEKTAKCVLNIKNMQQCVRQEPSLHNINVHDKYTGDFKKITFTEID